MQALPDTGHINVRHMPPLYPFSGHERRFEAPAGRSIAQIVLDTVKSPLLARQTAVFIDHQRIPYEMWPHIRAKPGIEVDVRVVPHGGGGGKNPLSTILSIGLMAAAPALGASLTASMGGWVGSTFVGVNTLSAIAGGAISIVGRLAIGALIPPAKQRSATSSVTEKSTQFVTGARNQLVPFNPVPFVAGKTRIVPPYAAKPYTETIGNDQYVRMLFCCGYGPLDLSEFKLGETALTEFTDYEIEVRQGYEDDAPISLFSNSVVQDDYSVLLTQAVDWVTRTSATDAEEMSIDFTFQSGLTKFNGSSRSEVEVKLEAQYRKTGTTGDWSAGIGSYNAIAAKTSPAMIKPAVGGGINRRRLQIWRIVMDPLSGALKAVSGTVTTVGTQADNIPAVPSGMLRVAQVLRYSDDPTIIPAARIINERDASLVGTVFQTSTDFAPSVNAAANVISVAAGGLKQNGIVIKANQASALRRSFPIRLPEKGQYDVRVRRVSPDTTSDQIFDKVTLTAIRSVRYVAPVKMKGVALVALRIKGTDQLNGAPDQFNCIAQSIVRDWNAATNEWVMAATSNPASLYRHVLQSKANKAAATDAAINLAKLQKWHTDCQADGFEYNGVIDSVMSVRDLLAEIAAAGRARVSMNELIWSVIQDKAQEMPVAVFTPRNTWDFNWSKTFPDIPHGLRVRFINAEKGYVVDEVIVYMDGYTAENATIYESMETPGVTNYQQAWRMGRYYLANIALRPETYSFRADFEHLRCTRGDLIRFQHDVILSGISSARIKSVIVDGAGDTVGVTVDDPFLMTDEVSYAVRIRTSTGNQIYKALVTDAGMQKEVAFTSPIPAAEGIATGDLIAFGVAGQETIPLIVKEIIPDKDLNAVITCVDYSPAIYTADTGAIPPHNSVVTLPLDMQRPPRPVIIKYQGDESVLVFNPDGSISAPAVITLQAPSWPVPLTTVVKYRQVGETDYVSANATVNGNRITIMGLQQGFNYDFKIYYTSQINGRAMSAARDLLNQTFAGDSNPPADVEDFRMNVLGQTSYFSWSPNVENDLDHYVMKQNSSTEGATWENSIDYMPSLGKTQTSLAVPAQNGTYLIKAVDRGGRLSVNAAVIVNKINTALGLNFVEDLDESPGFTGTKTGVFVDGDALQLVEGGQYGVYEFSDIIDLGEVYTSMLSAYIEVTGLDRNENMDAWPNVDLVPNWDGGADPAMWGVTIQVSWTNDDPMTSPTWSPWTNLLIGNQSARAYRYRAILTAENNHTTPVITQLSVQVDMPDRTDGQESVTGYATDTAGTEVVHTGAFRVVPAIGIAVYGGQTGDRYEITDQTPEGFKIKFFNSAGTRVTRAFSYVAKGYGLVQTTE